MTELADLPDAKLPDGCLPCGFRPFPRGQAAKRGFYGAGERAILRELDRRMDRDETATTIVPTGYARDTWRQSLERLHAIGYIALMRWTAEGQEVGITQAGDRALRLGGQ